MVSSESNRATSGPDFINVGPGRCASSWLLEVLQAHPEIGMAKIKETEFFNTNFERGNQWYESLFSNSRGRVIGEISNCYYTQPEVASRIFDYDPKTKIIINVRDPFTLLSSFHGFGVRRGLPLTNVVDDLDFHVGKVMGSGYDYRAKKGILNLGDTESLLGAVMLARHLRPFFEIFPPNQIYVFIFERLKTQSAEVVQEIYRFLEVDESFQTPVTGERVNEAIVPKSKILGQAAMNFAFFLRQVGAYKILDELKKSRLVKNLFYSKTGPSGKKVNLREALPADVCRKIEDQMCELITLYPPLADWWNPVLIASEESR